MSTEQIEYKKKDYASDQDVKWCPGCGDYAILSAVQQSMAKLQLKPEDTVVVSGIGCSSRFPYYMGTYGMHTIHGRAPGFATGIKLQNPDLNVWMITGDGDGLSIGGNHLAHIIRRNVNVNVLLFNNEIYGLTKGQYSPTSKTGLKTKSSPVGSVDRSMSPTAFAFGAGATFIARTIDTDPKHMVETFMEASKHEGLSFIEIYQNCVIFNDKVHDSYTNRKTRDEFSIRVKHGESLIYGSDQNKALALEGLSLKETANLDQALKYDVHNKMMAQMLCDHSDGSPVALGVLYKEGESIAYEKSYHEQLSKKKKPFSQLLHSGNTWTV